MQQSERLSRFRGVLENAKEILQFDENDRERMIALLNHPHIQKNCHVDAVYYDYSGIPQEIKDSEAVFRDCYLIFGVSTKGQIITKWVDRWDLDSTNPIVDGKVINTEKTQMACQSPPSIIKQFFDKTLLMPSKNVFFERL